MYEWPCRCGRAVHAHPYYCCSTADGWRGLSTGLFPRASGETGCGLHRDAIANQPANVQARIWREYHASFGAA